MARDYVTYDEIEDVLASTDLLRLIAPKLKKQPALWKWAVIAAQNGLQGAIVCALHDGVGASVLTEKSARDLLRWHREGRRSVYPKALRLADFWTLVGRFCRQNPLAKENVSRWQIRDIHKLHSHFRNGFEHFQPQTWSIEKAGLPRIVAAATDLIEIAMADRVVENRLTGNGARRLKKNLAETRAALLRDAN
jgi:hypothetical protein